MPYPYCSNAVFCFPILTQQFRQTRINFWRFTPRPSRCRHYKRCESSMFHLRDLAFIKAFFLFLVSFIRFREFLLCISSGVGIKHLFIKECHLACLPKPRAYMSNLTSFPVAVDGVKHSPVNDRNRDSPLTSWHNSLRSDDVMFLTRLCRNDTRSPFYKSRHAEGHTFHHIHNNLEALCKTNHREFE